MLNSRKKKIDRAYAKKNVTSIALKKNPHESGGLFSGDYIKKKKKIERLCIDRSNWNNFIPSLHFISAIIY